MMLKDKDSGKTSSGKRQSSAKSESRSTVFLVVSPALAYRSTVRVDKDGSRGFSGRSVCGRGSTNNAGD